MYFSLGFLSALKFCSHIALQKSRLKEVKGTKEKIPLSFYTQETDSPAKEKDKRNQHSPVYVLLAFHLSTKITLIYIIVCIFQMKELRLRKLIDLPKVTQLVKCVLECEAFCSNLLCLRNLRTCTARLMNTSPPTCILIPCPLNCFSFLSFRT